MKARCSLLALPVAALFLFTAEPAFTKCDPAAGWVPGKPCQDADRVGIRISGQDQSLQSAFDGGLLGSGGASGITLPKFVTAAPSSLLTAEVSPTAANQVPVSSSGTAAAWGQVPAAAIADNACTEAKLDAIDTPTDAECLTFQASSGRFEWRGCGGGGGDPTMVGDTTGTASANLLNASAVRDKLEAVMRLSFLQGAVTDAQVPDSIHVNGARTLDTDDDLVPEIQELLGTLQIDPNGDGVADAQLVSSASVASVFYGNLATQGIIGIGGPGPGTTTACIARDPSNDRLFLDFNCNGKTVTSPEAGESYIAFGDSSGRATTLADNSCSEPKLDAVDTPADGECLTFQSASGRFEYKACAAPTSAEYLVGTTDATLTGEIAPTGAGQVPVSTGGTVTWGQVSEPTLADNAVSERTLDAQVTPTNGQILSWVFASGRFNWINLPPALTDGTKSDIAVTSSGTLWDIVAGHVGTAELANGAVTIGKEDYANAATDGFIASYEASSGKKKWIAPSASSGVTLGNFAGQQPATCTTGVGEYRDLDPPYYLWTCTDAGINTFVRKAGPENGFVGTVVPDATSAFHSDLLYRGAERAMLVDRKISTLDRGAAAYTSMLASTCSAAKTACAPTVSYTAKAITALTSATPPVATVASITGFANGDAVTVVGALASGNAAHPINGGPYKIAGISGNTLQLQDPGGNAVVGASFPSWASGGVLTKTTTVAHTSLEFLVTDWDGASTTDCTGGGGTTGLFECKADGSVVQRVATKDIWKHTFTGADPGVGAVFDHGVVDWEEPWGHLYGSTAGNCVEDHWAVGPRYPAQFQAGKTTVLSFKVGLSDFSFDDLDATVSAWGWVSGDTVGPILNPAGTTAAATLQNVVNGAGVLWQGFKFYTFNVRNGVENLQVLTDLTTAGTGYTPIPSCIAAGATTPGTRLNFSCAKRSLQNAQVLYAIRAPATTDGAYREAWYRTGLGSLGSLAAPFTLAYQSAAGTANQTPEYSHSAAPVMMHTVHSACSTPTPAWATATAYVLGQRVTQASVTYVCLVNHTSGTFTTDKNAGDWVANAGFEDSYWGTYDWFNSPDS